MNQVLSELLDRLTHTRESLQNIQTVMRSRQATMQTLIRAQLRVNIATIEHRLAQQKVQQSEVAVMVSRAQNDVNRHVLLLASATTSALERKAAHLTAQAILCRATRAHYDILLSQTKAEAVVGQVQAQHRLLLGAARKARHNVVVASQMHRLPLSSNNEGSISAPLEKEKATKRALADPESAQSVDRGVLAMERAS